MYINLLFLFELKEFQGVRSFDLVIFRQIYLVMTTFARCFFCDLQDKNRQIFPSGPAIEYNSEHAPGYGLVLSIKLPLARSSQPGGCESSGSIHKI